jgi:small GTP-binding protein
VTPTIYKKICLLGDFAVGKTSLVRRYVDNQFSDDYLTTVGVKLSRKLIEVPKDSGERVALQLIVWDLEGKSDFAETSNAYLQGASGALIVGDLTRPDTIANIANHVEAFLAINPRSHIIAAYNKGDLLAADEQPTLPQFEEHDRVIGALRTSAKSGAGVEHLFASLAWRMIA